MNTDLWNNRTCGHHQFYADPMEKFQILVSKEMDFENTRTVGPQQFYGKFSDPRHKTVYLSSFMNMYIVNN